ncbi:MAG: 4Fe-4S dicluster domain-containing protein [Thermodesulfobacteriota bacterium]
MKRRFFLKSLAGLALLLGEAGRAPAAIFASPLTSNRLRPPGAVSEEEFVGKCIRCGRCVEVCPYRCITPLDIRHGVQAGTPLINVVEIPCYLCMKCVKVCPTGTLADIDQQQTRMGLAILNRHLCFNWQGMTMCRTCYDVCPFKEQAIRLDELRPLVIEESCVGCGICVHSCPISAADGSKAINVVPLARESLAAAGGGGS